MRPPQADFFFSALLPVLFRTSFYPVHPSRWRCYAKFARPNPVRTPYITRPQTADPVPRTGSGRDKGRAEMAYQCGLGRGVRGLAWFIFILRFQSHTFEPAHGVPVAVGNVCRKSNFILSRVIFQPPRERFNVECRQSIDLAPITVCPINAD